MVQFIQSGQPTNDLLNQYYRVPASISFSLMCFIIRPWTGIRQPLLTPIIPFLYLPKILDWWSEPMLNKVWLYLPSNVRRFSICSYLGIPSVHRDSKFPTSHRHNEPGVPRSNLLYLSMVCPNPSYRLLFHIILEYRNLIGTSLRFSIVP